jgi:uncharacterized protein YacL (UPF0231 family)
MDFPVADVVEQAVSSQVNALVGNSDVNLNTILKMSLLNEIKPLGEDKINAVLQQMKSNNAYEKHLIEQDYLLTMDTKGNLIYANNIKYERKEEDNSGSIVPEPKRSE